MTLYSGFFNAISGDRTYDAKQMSRLFDGIISDGVFASIGTAFTVSPSSGMSLSVGIGRAWFNHTWTFNDSVMIINIQESEVVLNRLDLVVLEVNTSDEVRANSIKIIKGTPATNPVAPTPLRTETVNQYTLAIVSVLAGEQNIGSDKITNKVGTVDCPLITGILEPIDIATFLEQWNAQFEIWFDEMKDQLSTDAAGNLQNQINNIPILQKALEADIISGTDDLKYVTPLGLSKYPSVFPGAMIDAFIFSSIPQGWLKTNGQEISRTTYSALFSKIGTIFGSGNGSTTFLVPLILKDIANYVQVTSSPTQRIYHTLTLLPDGRLLMVGGSNASAVLNTTYFGTISGNTITWAAGTALPITLNGHTTTLLNDGRILVVAGYNGSSVIANTYFGTISGNTITWAAGTALPTTLNSHASILLPDGRLLVIGGHNGTTRIANTYFGTISGNTITWAAGTAYTATINRHNVVLLNDGRILVVGGYTGSAVAGQYFGTISGNTITWVAGTALPTPTYGSFVYVIDGGRVLVCGGAPTTSTQTNLTYLGTISGNTITWVAGKNLPIAMMTGGFCLTQNGLPIISGGLGVSSAVLSENYMGVMPMGLIKT